VWSWRRDPGVKPRGKAHAGDGGKKGRSPGRARISRKAIARGKPGCPGCTCGLTRVHFCSTPTHTGLRAQSAPGFPCALCSRREQEFQQPGRKTSRGNADCCLNTESANSVHLAPLAGRGRRASARRVRGTLRESECADRAPHPNPLPAKGGERERVSASSQISVARLTACPEAARAAAGEAAALRPAWPASARPAPGSAMPRATPVPAASGRARRRAPSSRSGRFRSGSR
jgi:hypothetical protein